MKIDFCNYYVIHTMEEFKNILLSIHYCGKLLIVNYYYRSNTIHNNDIFSCPCKQCKWKSDRVLLTPKANYYKCLPNGIIGVIIRYYYNIQPRQIIRVILRLSWIIYMEIRNNKGDYLLYTFNRKLFKHKKLRFIRSHGRHTTTKIIVKTHVIFIL